MIRLRVAHRTYAPALLALCLAAGVCGPAQAQWMWRDAKGQVTASDRPPPRDIAEKDILARPTASVPRAAPAATPASAAPGVAAPASSPLEAEVEARRRAAEQQAAAQAKADDERLAAQRAENCRRARGHLAALESGQRMARTNERGEREVLDDKGRAGEMRQARAVIASDCR
ncbi:MAG: DUF4124 domain-containing protein [Proteobacteria bacterium]|nr:DUF4124 domain-containing protein [Pseudomonadota bacterium]HOL37008.1 DUF4124 domain-containing protein [Rubrivivax sp.]